MGDGDGGLSTVFCRVACGDLHQRTTVVRKNVAVKLEGMARKMMRARER
jgi:hypothetical protein